MAALLKNAVKEMMKEGKPALGMIARLGRSGDIARILGEGATELLGQSIIIDNRSGAGGQTRAVNRVPACGM